MPAIPFNDATKQFWRYLVGRHVGVDEIDDDVELRNIMELDGVAGDIIWPGSFGGDYDTGGAVITDNGDGTLSDSSVPPNTWYSKTRADSLSDTQTHTASDITDLQPVVDQIVQVSSANSIFGSQNGVPIKPWEKALTTGPELWALTNFNSVSGTANTTTLTPTLTPNATAQSNFTRVSYGSVAGFEAFRIEFDYTTPNTGWGGISLRIVDGSGVQIGGEQWLATVATAGDTDRAGRVIFDFAPGVVSGAISIEVKLQLFNNVTAGSGPLSISNVSVRQITSDASRPMLVSQEYSTGAYPFVFFQHRDVKTNTWKISEVSFGPESSLTPFSTMEIFGYYNDNPWVTGKIPDPAMARLDSIVTSNTGNHQTTGTPKVSLRANNNDQIHVVWNGSAYEYRGNTHGGEFTRASPGVSLKIDRGAGLVPWTLERVLQGARRFQVSIPSEYRRTVDGTTPYCTVDRTITCFPDGMMRTDRTTTFTQTTTVLAVFDWMTSHDMTVPYLGRIGRGSVVLGETDSHPKVVAPVAPTFATSTTGGVLAAGTYSYRVAAITPYGETTPSPAATQVTTGSTSTVTVNWAAATNATGYRIYGRTANLERLLTTVGPVTTWVDTGDIAAGFEAPKTVNTARFYNNTTANTMAQSEDVFWGVYKEPRTGWCLANIYDRDAILSRTGVSAAHMRLMRGAGIQKNYTNVVFSPSPAVVPAGTVWTATHYTYLYLPADPDNYHDEAAQHSSNLSAIKSIYTIT